MRLVLGIGVNDGKYPTKIKGKATEEYRVWKNMLYRCSTSCWVNRPTYVGTTCSDNFKSFSFFHEWYQEQPNSDRRDEGGKRWQLDKDILAKGIKVYSEDTCVFIPQPINNLLTKSDAARGAFPIGITCDSRGNRYRARCSNGTGNQTHLGCYRSLEAAFEVYKSFKEELIKSLATSYKVLLGSRVYEALMAYEVTIND